MDYTQAEYPWGAATATLEVRGDDLDPDVVSARLGLEPTRMRRPGPDRRDPDGEQVGLWLLDASPRRGRSLVAQLEALSEVAEAHAEALGELRARGLELRVTAFGFVGGVAQLEISPECARRFGELGISLHLDPSTNSR